ncbi:MAG: transposase [Deltaproteobacteria bacterium]|nr:transposase [Deltaproteobacteria bacterium]
MTRASQLQLFAPPKHRRGRPPSGRAGVSHARRPAVSARRPHHVTVRVGHGVWNLRSQRCFSHIAGAMRAVRRREGFRVVHFSVQGNHVHLVTEADDRRALTNGLRALLIRVALRLNRLMARRGPLFADRYHERVLASPTQVRNVLRYVFGNHARHLAQVGKVGFAPGADPFCSAHPSHAVARAGPLTSDPESWLLRVGWTVAH